MFKESVHEIRVPRDRALGVLDSAQGPVTAGGTLRNGYFFSLDPDCALELLRRAGLETASEAADEGGEHTEPIEGCVGGASDRPAIVAVRAEQGFLRDQQLRRWGSSCTFCGRSLPELLVAAHIKPRWACSENERMDTRNVSMLAWPVRLRTRPGPEGPVVVGSATQGHRPGPRTGRGLEGPRPHTPGCSRTDPHRSQEPLRHRHRRRRDRRRVPGVGHRNHQRRTARRRRRRASKRHGTQRRSTGRRTLSVALMPVEDWPAASTLMV